MHRDGSPQNPYVVKTIQVCAKALHGMLATEFDNQLLDIQMQNKMLTIKLEADNDFYSQRQQVQTISREYSGSWMLDLTV